MHWDFALILLTLGTAVPLLGRRRVAHLMALLDTTMLDRLSLYASTIAAQCFIVAVILWRCAAHHTYTTDIADWFRLNTHIITICVALSAFVLVVQLIGLHRIGLRYDDSRRSLLRIALRIFPRDATERLGFVALVLTVAACEELIYRGFAQGIFQDWFNSVSLGIVASSVLFSVAHWYQGKRGLASTFLIGLLFASIRAWSGSLAPSIAAHFVADLTVGLLAPPRIRAALSKKAVSSPADLSHQRDLPSSQANA